MKLKKLGKFTTYFLYDTKIEGLKDILRDSIGIQCHIVKEDGDIYQGEIESFDFFEENQRIVKINLSWICKRRIATKTVEGALMQKEDRWDVASLVEYDSLLHYNAYYLNKYNRIKIKCKGVNWYLLTPDDLEKLILHDGKYQRIGKLKGMGDTAPHIEPYKK